MMSIEDRFPFGFPLFSGFFLTREVFPSMLARPLEID
jgi:hypothetical protein